jgi:predicted small secreted protein
MIKRVFSVLLSSFLLVALITAVSGCNTVAGAGKDIEKGGGAIKNEANEHKNY